MALNIALTFPSPINMSCRVGDTAYYAGVQSLGGFVVNNNINLIGTINLIEDNGSTTTITCLIENSNQNLPGIEGSFIFFSKNNLVEISSLTGYYAQATFTNNSSAPAELYAAACGITESSK